jgi:hypothetical protein
MGLPAATFSNAHRCWQMGLLNHPGFFVQQPHQFVHIVGRYQFTPAFAGGMPNSVTALTIQRQ